MAATVGQGPPYSISESNRAALSSGKARRNDGSSSFDPGSGPGSAGSKRPGAAVQANQLLDSVALFLLRRPDRRTDCNSNGNTCSNVVHGRSDSHPDCHTNRYSCTNFIQFDRLLRVGSRRPLLYHLGGRYRA